jgi:protocatechuate 3,4-dioxygenase beta subunit
MTKRKKMNPQAAVTASGAVTEPATDQSASAAKGSKAPKPPSVNSPSEKEQAELADIVKKNAPRKPIVIHQGEIVDGTNRCHAVAAMAKPNQILDEEA